LPRTWGWTGLLPFYWLCLQPHHRSLDLLGSLNVPDPDHATVARPAVVIPPAIEEWHPAAFWAWPPQIENMSQRGRSISPRGTNCEFRRSSSMERSAMTFCRPIELPQKMAWQKRAATLDASQVKQATSRDPLGRRRGSTVPPTPHFQVVPQIRRSRSMECFFGPGGTRVEAVRGRRRRPGA
jgi:hypothetical protein